MAIDLADHDRKAREAVMAFWGNRDKAKQKRLEAGAAAEGDRDAVRAGNNMDGFVALVLDLVHANGLVDAQVFRHRPLVTLPGYFRPTKMWDLLVIHRNRLVAAVEMKSQVGSYGNNYNNRTEEAIGSAQDLRTAYREGAFGEQPMPFVGWFMLVGDDPESREPVKNVSQHFPVFSVFEGASYQTRYEVLCRRLVQEQLYTAASVIASPRSAVTTGEFSEMSELTSLKTFVASFAGHIASAAAR